MNTNALKKYAIQARRDFLAAIADRAAQLGIAAPKGKVKEAVISPAQVTGGAVVIDGISHPLAIAEARQRVVEAIEARGYRAVIEQVAYTWFNRFVALRFMELHGYLDHGLRVLSNPGDAAVPEAVERLRELDLPTLDKAKAIELGMTGQQDEALLRMILLAQCKHLAPAMPWLFDTRLHDGVDLLLPEGLLATDSILAKLVEGIPEGEWTTVDNDGNDRSVEIIGWLYQFFISERKDEVIGKVVAPEDIPAATQLFTPNWIVQYLVQNSLGRLWLESHPESWLKAHMPYYIEPAEQEPEVQAQLDAIWDRPVVPFVDKPRMNTDEHGLEEDHIRVYPCSSVAQSFHDTRDVRSLKILDPACGSGHILLEAFRLLFQIYLEQGYRKREIPRLIFKHNLVGLDIDDRAAQLTGMSLLFEARQHDRRILHYEEDENHNPIHAPPALRVHAFQNGTEADLAAIDGSKFGMKEEAKALVRFFSDGKTFGSLLRLPFELAAKLPDLRATAERALTAGDLFLGKVGELLLPLIAQAEAIAVRYDAVVANPPYMGGKGMTKDLKDFAKNDYPRSKADTFAMFIERGFELANEHGFNSMVTMQSWMFLSSYEAMREDLLTKHTVHCLAHFPYDGKSPTVMGINFGVSVKCLRNAPMVNYKGHYCCSRWHELNTDGTPKEFPTTNERLKSTKQSDFAKIPGMPVAYWVSPQILNLFDKHSCIGKTGKGKVGLQTGSNECFVRHWAEVSIDNIGFNCGSTSEALATEKKWFPYNKGGERRKWYGNQEFVVNWEHDGAEIKGFVDANGKQRSRPQNTEWYFKESISWGLITSGGSSFRWYPKGFIYDVAGMSLFIQDAHSVLGALNTDPFLALVKILNPTLNLQIGDICNLPYVGFNDTAFITNVQSAIGIAKEDWDQFETSWHFSDLFGIQKGQTSTAANCWEAWELSVMQRVTSMQMIESHNNELFARSFDLEYDQGSLQAISEITLYQPAIKGDPAPFARCLLSYAIGCMMGRYSLDHQGLIYARAGNIGFDPSKYPTFPADEDGIIPLTDEPWFHDDATVRFEEFVNKAWPGDGNKPRMNTDKHGSEERPIRVHPCPSVASNHLLEENLRFVADALGPKKNETARDTIRRYFSNDFYKDHCQTYKKRPIYWLFSSGKHQAFQCLVYLHRYNADTLGRIRTEYVTPLHGKMRARLAHLEEERDHAASAAATKAAQKAIDTLTKKIDELATFDDQLRHYADQRIELDLDDGVKVNIQKFGGKGGLIDLKPLGSL